MAVGILDEPLSNLNAKLRRQVREQIRQVQQNLKLTAVYVTHDQEEAMAVSDRIIVMKNTEIAQMESPEGLYNTPNSEFIADFISDTNVLDCEVSAIKNALATVEIAGRKLKVLTKETKPFNASLIIRPQSIKFAPASKKAGIKGNVTYAAYLGNQIQYTLDTSIGELFIIDNIIINMFKVGSSVHIILDEKN